MYVSNVVSYYQYDGWCHDYGFHVLDCCCVVVVVVVVDVIRSKHDSVVTTMDSIAWVRVSEILLLLHWLEQEGCIVFLYFRRHDFVS
jgi:hypothetical protein